MGVYIATATKTRNKNIILMLLPFCGLLLIIFSEFTPILMHRWVQANRKPGLIKQGEDPTTVLEATAAGEQPVSGKCNTTDFLYGISRDGYLFIHRLTGNQYAVDVVGTIRHFMFNTKGQITGELLADANPGELDCELANMLNLCKKSLATPRPIKIRLGDL